MRRTLAALAIAVVAGGLVASGDAGAATKPAPKPAASKDPCASKPSKYQRDQCRKFNASAPGDEYFGRLKLSYLGINNTFHDEAIAAGAWTTDPGIISKVSFADDALRAWMARYPNDPDLARSTYLGILMFEKIYTRPYQDKAWDYMHMVIAKFPDTYFAKQLKKDLAIGFTEHILADPLPCPTPLPPGAVVLATPNPAPTPTPAPGRPNVLYIQQSCIPPPTPTPIPTATPVPTATPATTPAPAGTATPLPLPTTPGTATPYPSPTPVPLPTTTPYPTPTLTP